MLTEVLLALQLVSGSDDAPVEHARRAQRSFESMRRMHLPRLHETGSHPCHARIGRLCYWHDPGDSVRVPEPPIIAAARAELIRHLNEVGSAAPENNWVVGQRVRYLLESGSHDDAIAAAGECRADRWWCAALAGLSLHTGGRDIASDSAFTSALAAMDEDQRCEWLDVGMLSGDRLPCAQRAALAEVVWLMGQPLWSRPARDFRSEFLARRTMNVIMKESANAHGMSWGPDNTELLLRYGWSRWYSRERSASASVYETDAVHGHGEGPGIAVLPETPLDAHTLPRLAEDAWSFERPVAVARYAPRYLTAILPLRHQIARFPRGDSVLVVAAFSNPDTILARDSVAVHLASYDGDTVRRSVPGDRHLTVPGRTMVASLEVVGTTTRRAARARVTVDPLRCQQTACLSDLLLYATDSAVGSIAEALDSAGALEFSAHRALGVLWETVLPPATRARITLTIEPARASFVRRLGVRLGLVRSGAAMRLRWETVARPGDELQSVALALPTQARGAHVLTVTVEPVSGPPMPAMSARREFTLTAAPPGVSPRQVPDGRSSGVGGPRRAPS